MAVTDSGFMILDCRLLTSRSGPGTGRADRAVRANLRWNSGDGHYSLDSPDSTSTLAIRPIAAPDRVTIEVGREAVRLAGDRSSFPVAVALETGPSLASAARTARRRIVVWKRAVAVGIAFALSSRPGFSVRSGSTTIVAAP